MPDIDVNVRYSIQDEKGAELDYEWTKNGGLKTYFHRLRAGEKVKLIEKRRFWDAGRNTFITSKGGKILRDFATEKIALFKTSKTPQAWVLLIKIGYDDYITWVVIAKSEEEARKLFDEQKDMSEMKKPIYNTTPSIQSLLPLTFACDTDLNVYSISCVKNVLKREGVHREK